MVTKAELAERLFEQVGLNKREAKEFVDSFFDVMRDALARGGTVSGPVMMTVADVALYVAILADIGIVPLAVTTSLNFNFMRKPASDRAIIGVCTMMKIGRSLAVGEVNLYSEGQDEPVAHAVGTYAIPR